MHFHEIREGSARYPKMIAGLDYALDPKHDDVPTEVREQVRKLYDEAVLVRSELWERMIYGYYRNCYSPDGVERRADRLIIDRAAEDPPLPPENHAGYLMVKKYFPDAQPRLDLIADSTGGYGQHPCAKCGLSVQYEPAIDAFAETRYSRRVRDCVAGGFHETEFERRVAANTEGSKTDA